MTETIYVRKINNNNSLGITLRKEIIKKHRLNEGDLIEINIKKVRIKNG